VPLLLNFSLYNNIIFRVFICSFAFVDNKLQSKQTSRKGAKTCKKSKNRQEEMTGGPSHRAKKVAQWGRAVVPGWHDRAPLFARSLDFSI